MAKTNKKKNDKLNQGNKDKLYNEMLEMVTKGKQSPEIDPLMLFMLMSNDKSTDKKTNCQKTDDDDKPSFKIDPLMLFMLMSNDELSVADLLMLLIFIKFTDKN